MREESRTSYAVIRYNFRTYAAGGVMAVVKGRDKAEEVIKQYESGQTPIDRQEGWRYFVEPTDIKPGTDPAEATNMRQSKLELRESESQS